MKNKTVITGAFIIGISALAYISNSKNKAAYAIGGAVLGLIASQLAMPYIIKKK